MDGFRRRVAKRVDGVLERAWLYRDGLNPVAELDGAGRVRLRFVYGPRPHVPAYAVEVTTGRRLRYVTDHLGSVRQVVDVATGTVVQELAYDPWGRVLVDTRPGYQPFGYAGGLYDPDTGLVRFGARDYDASVGRWTARDPILFQGGDPNLYGYVLGDPVNKWDVTGLVSMDDPCATCFLVCTVFRLNNDMICVALGAGASMASLMVGGAVAIVCGELSSKANDRCFEECLSSGSCNNQCRPPTGSFGFR